MDKSIFFKSIPKVDVLLEEEKIRELLDKCDRKWIIEAIRCESDKVRSIITASEDEESIRNAVDGLVDNVVQRVNDLLEPNLRNVINATGTILHTNLGRAPISRRNAERLTELMCGYSNLEYDLEAGKRGERYSSFEKLVCALTGAEAALAVNNNASAVMLILHALGCEKEVIVSRGELVEVGGSFRIPDVMSISRARLIEVGTTNKTHASDYENAINEKTGALMKVHTSNYRVMGFTESVSIEDLVKMGRDRGIPVIEDLGSGAILDLSAYGLEKEPMVQESIEAGVDIVCFSGDKMLGGPQAGIIAGRKKYIDIIKKDQLLRALRIDKFTTAALELTLLEYLNEKSIRENIPFLKAAAATEAEVKEKAELLCGYIRERTDDRAASVQVIADSCQIGGGSMPLVEIASYAVSVAPAAVSVNCLEKRLRHASMPVIGRIAEGVIILDVRTIPDELLLRAAESVAECISKQ